VRIDAIGRHPQHIPDLAAWHHAEWGPLYDDWTLEAATAELADHATMQALYGQVAARAGETKFLGYETTSSTGNVIAILRDGTDYQELEAVPEAELRAPADAEAEIVLDQTPFYAEGGGQVGDQGVLRSADGAEVFTVTEKAPKINVSVMPFGTMYSAQRNAYEGTGDSLLADPKIVELYLGTLAQVE